MHIWGSRVNINHADVHVR